MAALMRAAAPLSGALMPLCRPRASLGSVSQAGPRRPGADTVMGSHCRTLRASATNADGQGDNTAAFGPEPPPEIPENAPEWVKDLYRDADYDEELREVIDGTNGNPDLIRAKMRAANERAAQRIAESSKGQETPMGVEFREVDTMNLWIWMKFWSAPSSKEMEMLTAVIESWYMLGKLGGYNSSNLQLFYRSDENVSFMKYENSEIDRRLPGFMHEITELESRGDWSRFWVDMGTADEMALDILINALAQFSQEYFGIQKLVIGGVNSDWTEGTEKKAPEVSRKASIDPMRGSLPADRVDRDELDQELRNYLSEEYFPDGGYSVEDRRGRSARHGRVAPRNRRSSSVGGDSSA